MTHSRFVARIAFAQFALAVSIMTLGTCFPVLESFGMSNAGSLLWVVGTLALLATATGFLRLRCPQGKVAALGGLLLLIAVVLVLPLGTEITAVRPLLAE